VRVNGGECERGWQYTDRGECDTSRCSFQASPLKNTEVHHYSGVEQLGVVQAIVFDKTGTLTANSLVPKRLNVFEGESWDVHETEIRWDAFPQRFHLLQRAILLNNTCTRLVDRSV
jgi:magnesium-transporting ATPase (P-type)